MKPNLPPAAVPVVLTLALLLSVPGCPPPANQFQPPPPPEVTVAPPVVRTVQPYFYTTGITEARRTVEVRPRVSGYITRIAFRDGQTVKGCAILGAGDQPSGPVGAEIKHADIAEAEDPAKIGATLLFEIDRRPFEAARDKAKADVGIRKAVHELAETELKKKEAALAKNAIAELEVIRQRAEAARAKADVEAAEALLKSAELDLSYTRIYAPIDGRISRTEVQLGDLVGPAGGVSAAGRALAVVVQDRPIYANYNFSDREVISTLRKMRRSRPDAQRDPGIAVDLALDDEAGYPHKGLFDYADPTVDQSTGTYRFRAVFPNDDGMLVPGLYVKLRARIFDPAEAMLVPDRAIGSDQIGRFVLVVSKDDTVEQRPVTVGDLQEDGMRVITKGLSREDRVIVNGLQRARPGGKVTPKAAEATKSETPKAEPTKPDPKPEPAPKPAS
jgi:RND family efflux transporter MFP subunit